PPRGCRWKSERPRRRLRATADQPTPQAPYHGEMPAFRAFRWALFCGWYLLSGSSCFEQDAPEPVVSAPRDDQEPEDHDGHDGGFASSPACGSAQADQREIDAPSEKGDGNFRLRNPPGAHFDERP